jgi:hypothetical protein
VARVRCTVALIAVAAAACSRDQGGVSHPRGKLSIAPESIDFGNVVVDSQTEAKLALKNEGVSRIDICLANLADDACPMGSALVPRDSPFMWPLADMMWTVAAGDNPTFSIGFQPHAVGSFEASLALGHDGLNGPTLSIPLKGNAVLPELDTSDDHIAFGRVRLGHQVIHAFELTNNTMPPAAVPIHAHITTSTLAFAIIDDNGDRQSDATITVEANAKAIINVAFLPSVEQGFVSSLDLRYCTGCTKSIALSGAGAQARIDVEPLQLDFGMHPDSMPASRTFQIRSTGTATLTITALDALDADTFKPSGMTVPFDLPPGQQASITVTHAGNNPGLEVGRLQVGSDASPSTVDLQLVAEAIGPKIDARPSALMFGRTKPNALAVSRPVALRNIGNAPLTVSDVRATQNPDFSLVLPQLPLVVMPGTSLSISVQFAPAANGPSRADLAITSDDFFQGTLVIPVSGEGGDPTGCAMFFTPPTIALGGVERGLAFTVPLSVTNLGSQSCAMTNGMLRGDPTLSLTPVPPSPLAIAPNAIGWVPVTFLSTTYGAASATLEAATNDPDLGMLSIPVSAVSEAPGVRVLPKELDFGQVPVNCRSTLRPVRIENLSQQTVTIANPTIDSFDRAAFNLAAVNAPLSIAPNQFIELSLRYQPVDPNPDTAILTIASSSDMAPAVVSMRGVGRTSGQVNDHFQRGLSKKSDVLFVVEGGGRNGGITSLAAQISALFAFAQMNGVDYHIAAVSMSPRGNATQGVFNVSSGVAIILPETPNGAADLATNLDERGGGGAPGFDTAFFALSDPLLNDANNGFFRADANLSVVFVSSFDDESQLDAGFYEAFLDYLKRGVSTEVTASAIVGTSANVCVNNNSFAELAPRFVDMTDRTGGVALDYCGDWAQNVAALAPYAFGLSRAYPLSAPAVAASLNVRVGGTTVPAAANGVTNWTYDPARNRVLFSAASTPAPGASVRISYTTDCP